MKSSDRDFGNMIRAQWASGKLLCIGLDSDVRRIPASCLPGHDDAARTAYFNESIIEATGDLASAYKLNTAFYEVLGSQGIYALARTVGVIQRLAPDVPVVIDAKRADIANTNECYAQVLYDEWRADAITVHPYLGREALRPFLERAEKGVFVLARTSNPGAGEFQDLLVDGRPLYLHVASTVASTWNTAGNCGVVAGATFSSELKQIRAAVGDLPMLIPGVGTQGGSLETVLSNSFVPPLGCLLVNASRSILFASSGDDYDQAARSAAKALHDAITTTAWPEG